LDFQQQIAALIWRDTDIAHVLTRVEAELVVSHLINSEKGDREFLPDQFALPIREKRHETLHRNMLHE
jgi:hypothetical protein